jgi:hypothetical protein
MRANRTRKLMKARTKDAPREQHPLTCTGPRSSNETPPTGKVEGVVTIRGSSKYDCKHFNAT